jgi:hypothetical protein
MMRLHSMGTKKFPSQGVSLAARTMVDWTHSAPDDRIIPCSRNEMSS